MKAKNDKRIVEYRFYDLPVDFPAILLKGDEWHISAHKSSRYHFHNCMEIGFCHSGNGYLEFENGVEIPFQAGDITIIPHNLPHTTYSTVDSTSLWSYIFIDMTSLFSDMVHINKANYDEQEDPRKCHFTQGSHPMIYSLAKSMMDEISEQKKKWQTVFKSNAISLYFLLERYYYENPELEQLPSSKSSYTHIKGAIEIIKYNYMNKMSIAELSAQCHISENHFRRLFGEVMGTSPHAYINFTRINQACILLGSTGKPIIDISESVGFHSMASFNRNFKELLGITPREYRKRLQNKSSDETGDTITPRLIQRYRGWLQAERHPG